MRRVDRRAGEGQQGAEQAHLHHGEQQGADARRRRRAAHGPPEAQGAEQEARLHEPVGGVAGEGRRIGAGRVPGPQDEPVDEGPGERSAQPAASLTRRRPGQERRGRRDQQHVVDDAGREQGRAERAERGDERDGQRAHAGEPEAAALHPRRADPGEGGDQGQHRQQPGIEIPAARQVAGDRPGAAVGRPEGLLGHGLARSEGAQGAKPSGAAVVPAPVKPPLRRRRRPAMFGP